MSNNRWLFASYILLQGNVQPDNVLILPGKISNFARSPVARIGCGGENPWCHKHVESMSTIAETPAVTIDLVVHWKTRDDTPVDQYCFQNLPYDLVGLKLRICRRFETV